MRDRLLELRLSFRRSMERSPRPSAEVPSAEALRSEMNLNWERDRYRWSAEIADGMRFVLESSDLEGASECSLYITLEDGEEWLLGTATDLTQAKRLASLIDVRRFGA